MMKKVLFYSFVLVFISGCSFQSIVGASNEYRLDTQSDAKSYGSKGCSSYVLQVKNIDTYSPIQSRSIYYSVGDYELSTYTKSNWQDIPSKTIKSSIVNELRDAGIFKEVVSNRSSVEPDYLLEYSVEDFIQHFSEDMKSSEVRVKIHFSLMDHKRSRLLYSTTIEKKLPSASFDAIGGIKSLSTALNDVIKENNQWLDGICKEEMR